MVTRNRYRPTRSLALVFIACIQSLSAHAGGSQSFALSPALELGLGLPALGLFGAGLAVEPRDGGAAFGWPDEGFSFPYSPAIDRAGTLSLALGAAALPFLLDSFDARNALTLGMMFSEAALLTVGAKDILKAAVSRPRPYLEQVDAPIELTGDGDAYASFPSGHASLSFMSAAFCTYVYAQGNTSATSKWLMGISTFCLAGASSALRVAGGSHYLGDVLAGAALGSLIGVAVPFLHRGVTRDGADLSVSPLALSLTLNY